KQECADSLLHQSLEGDLDLPFGAGFQHVDLQPERARRLANLLYLGCRDRIGWIYKKGDHGRLRHEFVQQLKPLRPQRERHPAYAWYVTAWPTQAGDETVLDRVAACLEADWDRRGCRFCGEGGG